MDNDGIIREELANNRLWFLIYFTATITGFYILFENVIKNEMYFEILGGFLIIHSVGLVAITLFTVYFCMMTWRFLDQNKKLMKKLKHEKEE